MQYELNDNIADGEMSSTPSTASSTAKTADSSSQRPCVIVADDHALVRDGIRLLVGQLMQLSLIHI